MQVTITSSEEENAGIHYGALTILFMYYTSYFDHLIPDVR